LSTYLATWREPGTVALEAAREREARGGSLLDCLEAGLIACEEDENLIAIGRGSLPNAEGDLELDASIMEGENLEAGAVCGVRGILPVISVARMVMEQTPHVMLCGDQARQFAIRNGFSGQNLHTAESIRRTQEWLASGGRERALSKGQYVHSKADEPHDTVTMLGLAHGKCAAASSTSGMPWKLPGRVGDSPIVGAGIYADDEAGCAGATGWGEQLWRAGASLRAVDFMRQGMSAQEACEAVIRHMERRMKNPFALPCVVLALDKSGGYGAACGGGGFELWAMVDGAISMTSVDPIA
jgi:isoaspartyl peptidase/L-asparaginase-like protein (Ntn-hydrolase superfamily)